MTEYKEKTYSIIIPCYNVETYVSKCVESLRQQTYPKLEILLINDGSTDHTLEECRRMEKKYADVRLVEYEDEMLRSPKQEAARNRGQEAARNRGLEAARGEWICFLDADDTLDVNFLERGADEFETYPDIDLIVTALLYTFDNEKKNRMEVIGLSDGIYMAKDIAEALLEELPWGICSCIGNKIYRRSFIEQCGLRFDSKYKFNEDGAFNMMALGKAGSIRLIQDVSYRYYQRPGSIMHSYREKAFESLDKVNDLLEEYFAVFHLKEKAWLIAQRRTILAKSLLMDEVIYQGYKSYIKLFLQLYENEKINYAFWTVYSCKEISRKDHLICHLFIRRNMKIMYVFIKARLLGLRWLKR